MRLSEEQPRQHRRNNRCGTGKSGRTVTVAFILFDNRHELASGVAQNVCWVVASAIVSARNARLVRGARSNTRILGNVEAVTLFGASTLGAHIFNSILVGCAGRPGGASRWGESGFNGLGTSFDCDSDVIIT